MIKTLILWSIVGGLVVVAWYRPIVEVAAYILLVIVGMGVWGSILKDRWRKEAKSLSPKERVLADIDITCEVKGCGKVSEIECLGINLCYQHWRLLRPRGVRCLWGFKQKGDKNGYSA